MLLQAAFAEVQRIHEALDRIRNPEEYEDEEEEEKEEEAPPPPPPKAAAKKAPPPKKGKAPEPEPEPEPESEPVPEPETEQELMEKQPAADAALEKATAALGQAEAQLTQPAKLSRAYIMKDLGSEPENMRSAVTGGVPLKSMLYVYQAPDPPLPEPEPVVSALFLSRRSVVRPPLIFLTLPPTHTRAHAHTHTHTPREPNFL